MNSSMSTHVRALLLTLLWKTHAMKVQDIHSLLFAVGSALYDDEPSAFLGFTFIRDTFGPFSLELMDLLIAMKQEGLVLQVGDGPDARVALTPVGRAFEAQYAELVPDLRGLVERIAQHKDLILRLVGERMKYSRFGEIVVFTSDPSVSIRVHAIY